MISLNLKQCPLLVYFRLCNLKVLRVQLVLQWVTESAVSCLRSGHVFSVFKQNFCLTCNCITNGTVLLSRKSEDNLQNQKRMFTIINNLVHDMVENTFSNTAVNL